MTLVPCHSGPDVSLDGDDYSILRVSDYKYVVSEVSASLEGPDHGHGPIRRPGLNR